MTILNSVYYNALNQFNNALMLLDARN